MRIPVSLNRTLQLTLSGLLLAAGATSAATFTVSNTNDSGVGSLREAINAANANPGPDTVWFVIGSGAKTITLFSTLPDVNGPTFFDGWVQGGYSGTPLIRIDANGSLAHGMRTYGDGTTLRGLIFTEFQTGLMIGGGNGVTVRGCYFGTTGNSSGNGNGTGIRVYAGSNITLGGALAGDGNLISGNTGTGIYVDDAVTGLNLYGNRIGTNAAGTAAIANGATGLRIFADDVVIGGNSAALRNQVSGNTGGGILIHDTSSAVSVLGNYIGVSANGASALGNGSTGLSSAGDLVLIGGSSTADRNVVSGNAANGITIDSAASDVLVMGNYIGVNASGTSALANAYSGIGNYGDQVQIGGSSAAQRNLISGNGGDGISISSVANDVAILGNYVGVDVSGSSALANGGSGISSGGDLVQIGGSSAGARNLISGNAGAGVFIDSPASDVTILGNYIGVNVSGTSALANAGSGIRTYGSGVLIGGFAAAARNLISGNAKSGVAVESGSLDVEIHGNYIGVDVTGTSAIGNGGGISDKGIGTQIGSVAAGGGNVVSANQSTGISLSGSQTQVFANKIGTDVAGNLALGNGYAGIRIFGSSISIGGATAASGNLISGNSGGIELDGSANTVTIRSNRIGTNATGTAAIPNQWDGVGIHGTNIMLGDAIAGNLISGNGHNGVSIGSGQGISLRKNIIGLDAGGTFAIGNGDYGIRAMGAPGTLVGVAGFGNVISGNGRGFVLEYDAHDYVVQGNLIGTSANAANAIGNKEYGISISTPNNQIGGTAAGAGNVIAASKYYAVLIREQGGTGNHVEGNYIGTNAALASGLGNWFGVVLHGAHGNFIGGTAAGSGNVIANSINMGIFDWYGANNRFLGNRVYGNGGMGIDLDPQGPVPNDALDVDHGPNDGQNFPVVMLAQSQAGMLTISGRLSSAANANYRIEFFLSSSCDKSGMGEGEQYLGALDVLTNAVGQVSYATSIANNASSGFVSATATSSDGNTSEFSPCIAIGAASAGQFNFWRSPVLGYEDDQSMDVMVTRSVGVTGPASVTFTTLPQSAMSPADYAHKTTTLNFADGETVKSVTVGIVRDDNIEGNEKFTVALSNASNGAQLGAVAMPDVLLFDHDPQYPVYTVGDVSVSEPVSGQVTVQVPIHLSGGNHAVSIDYTTVDASATAGVDYQQTSGTVTFAAGELVKMIELTVLADAVDDGEEVFYLEITGSGEQDIIAGDSEGEIVIKAGPTGLLFANGFD